MILFLTYCRFKSRFYKSLILCLFISLFFFSFNPIKAQNNLDSLLKEGFRLKQEFKQDSAVIIYKTILDSLENEPRHQEHISRKEIEFEYAYALERANQNKKALLLLINQNEKYTKNNRDKTYIKIHLALALLYEKLGHEKETFQHLEIINDFTHDEHPDLLAHYYVRLSSAYRVFYFPDKSQESVTQALYFGKLYNDEENYFTAHMVQGFLLESKNDLNCLQHYKLTLKYFKKIKDTAGISAMQYAISTVLSKQNKLDSALLFGKKSFQTSQQNQVTKDMPFHFILLADHFEKVNLIDSALYYTKIAYEKNNTWLATQNHAEIIKITKQFDDLKKKNIIEKQKINLVVLLILSVFLIIFLLFMIRSNRRNKWLYKKNQYQKTLLIDKNKDLNAAIQQEQLLIRELHHRVKNNLQLILSLLELKNDENQTEEIKSRIYCIAAFHNLMYKDKLEDKVDVENYVLELIDYIVRSTFIYDSRPQISLDIDPILLNIETLIPLGLIINEALTNTIKHVSVKTNTLDVKICIRQVSENLYEMTYSDEGVDNINLNPKRKSLGIFIIQSMVRQLMGKMEINSQNGLNYKIEFREKN